MADSPPENDPETPEEELPWDSVKKAGTITPDFHTGFPSQRAVKLKLAATAGALVIVALSGLGILVLLSHRGKQSDERRQEKMRQGGESAPAAKFTEVDVLNDPKYEAMYVAISKGKIDRSLSLAETLEREYPGSIELAVLKATAYYRKPDWDTAREIVTGVIRKTQDHALALGLYGILVHDKGQIEESTLALAKGLSLDGSMIDGWYYQGVNYHKLGRHAEAEKAFRQALALRPTYTRASWDLALLYDAVGKPEAAEKVMEEAVKVAPGDASAHRYISMLYCRHGKYSAGEEHGRRAVDMAPFNPGNHSWLAEVFEFQSKSEEAIAAAEKAYTLARDDHRLQLQLGHLYSNAERFPESNLLLKRVVEREPENFFARLLLGRNQANLRRFAQAREHLEKAVEIEPESRHAWEILVPVYEGLNQPEKAAKTRAQLEALPLGEPAVTIERTPVPESAGLLPAKPAPQDKE